MENWKAREGKWDINNNNNNEGLKFVESSLSEGKIHVRSTVPCCSLAGMPCPSGKTLSTPGSVVMPFQPPIRPKFLLLSLRAEMNSGGSGRIRKIKPACLQQNQTKPNTPEKNDTCLWVFLVMELGLWKALK